MTVGTINFPHMHKVGGILLGTSFTGIKQKNRADIVVVQMPKDATCAGVFTQNLFSASPIQVAKEHIQQNPRWLLINSGNANAGNGKQGILDTLACCSALSLNLAEQNCNIKQILPFSTGVIGEPLPVKKITAALPLAVANLQEDNWSNAALAIMTTDIFAKGASCIINIDGHLVTLTGIAKGSGMIHPNMATLLGFIATDATIGQKLLQNCLSTAVEQSFNKITVDGDTSTNDACILMASGLSLAPEIKPKSAGFIAFSQALTHICKQLAELVIRDGEGASKLMRIRVEKAFNATEAIKVAKTIAHSPLVKTAFFASDPNWGRILAAVGRSGVNRLDLAKIEIYLDNICLVKNGGRAATYTEDQGKKVMHQDEIIIRVVLNCGNVTQEILSCDFSYDYVRINAEYRT